MNLLAPKKFAFIAIGFCLLTLSIGACQPSTIEKGTTHAEFETTPTGVPIQPGIINEASGLAASVNFPNYLWSIQDSGQPNAIYLISKEGKTIKSFNLPGTINHDWEDIAVGVGPEEASNYIYVSDIGNNNLPMTETNTIYRVKEPSTMEGVIGAGMIEKITFKYPDGPRDAEALLLDPATKSLYIISKEFGSTGLYKLAYPQSTTSTTTAEKVGLIPNLLLVTAGDISSAGDEILIRTYVNVNHWQIKAGTGLEETLLNATPKKYLIPAEPQGEAIAFDRNASGYFTLSEIGNASSVNLNYYKRK